MKTSYTRPFSIHLCPSLVGGVAQSPPASPAGQGPLPPAAFSALREEGPPSGPGHGNQEAEQHVESKAVSNYWLLNLMPSCLGFITCEMGI